MKTYILTLLQNFVVLLFPLLSGCSRSPLAFNVIVIVGMILFILALPLLLVVAVLGYILRTIKQILFWKEETDESD